MYAYSLANPVNWTDPSGRCVAWLNHFCDSIQTWTDFERAFPHDYPVSLQEAAQRAGQTPREAAEYAAYYETYANAPLTVFLINPSEGALAAEVFADYYLGESLIQKKQRDPEALAQAVTALDNLEVCRPLTNAEEWQRLTFLGILAGMGTDFMGPDRGGPGGGGGGRALNVSRYGITIQNTRIYAEFDTPGGVVAVGGRVFVEDGGQTMHISGIAIYATDEESVDAGLQAVLANRQKLINLAREEGFTGVRVTGVRTGGINPNRNIDYYIPVK